MTEKFSGGTIYAKQTNKQTNTHTANKIYIRTVISVLSIPFVFRWGGGRSKEEFVPFVAFDNFLDGISSVGNS